MDHATPPAPIDGIFTRLLILRDLVSGEQLLTRPTMGEGGDEVVQALWRLFEHQGPPLVLKRDKGSGLSADSVDLLLAFYGVLARPSRTYTPSSNGSAEAGVGSTKTRTESRSRGIRAGGPAATPRASAWKPMSSSTT